MIARGCAAELSVARSTNASKLARSRCKANLSFSKTRGAEEMFVAKQQLTSLSPPKKPDVSVGFFAVKREIESQQNKKTKSYYKS